MATNHPTKEPNIMTSMSRADWAPQYVTPFIEELVESIIDHADRDWTPNDQYGLDSAPSDDGMFIRITAEDPELAGCTLTLLDARGNMIFTADVRHSSTITTRDFAISVGADILANLTDQLS